MNGVEILNQTTIYETEMDGWPLIIFPIIGLLVMLIIAIVSWVKYGFDGDDIGWIVGATIACLLLGVFVTLLTEHETDTINYIEYKVTIDDSVSMNEFLDKYEILDQEGKIYTVKERE